MMENAMLARSNTRQAKTEGNMLSKDGLIKNSTSSPIKGWDKVLFFIKNSHKNVALITVFLSVLVTILVIALWAFSSSYRPLYGAQEPYNNSDILAALEADNIPYKMQPETGVILVEDNRVAEIRMLLAAKGVKANLPEGLTVLSEDSTLGTSQFIENARYNHGLEGELAKTIMSLNAVNNARVHLAIPKETLFVGRAQNMATGSVMLDVKAGESLSITQITAIINLVAGSVNNLNPESVSVTDQAGRLLSDDVNNGEYAFASSKQLDYKFNVESQIKKQAQSMLLPILGAENFRIESSADIDFSKREETRESFDSEPVLLNHSLSEDKNSSSIAIGIPGSLSTTPPLTDGEAPSEGNNNQNQRNKSSSNYAVGSAVSHTQFQQGVINHVSLSVVMNEDIAPEGGWSEADINKIEAMLGAAIGVNFDRGDTINVTSFTFSPIHITNPIAAAWYEEMRLESLLKVIVSALIAITLIFVVLRPLIKHITFNQPEQNDEAPEDAQVVDKEEEFVQRLSEYGIGENSENKDRVTQMLPDPNSPLNVQIQHLQLISKEHPERVSEILKNWVNA